MRALTVQTVASCLRGQWGGSPTAVTFDSLADDEVRTVLDVEGTSHVAVIGPDVDRRPRTVRFFSSTGELSGCAHGMVAAIAVLATAGNADFDASVRFADRSVQATGVVDRSGVVSAWFDQGPIRLRRLGVGAVGGYLVALGLSAGQLCLDDEPVEASPGAPRLLIPVADPFALDRIRPDQQQLVSLSRHLGHVGCFVYSPLRRGRCMARMFAPVIGVAEDVANGNSTGCLAAHQLTRSDTAAETVTVDQADRLGRPSTVHAVATRIGVDITARVGGTARVLGEHRVSLP